MRNKQHFIDVGVIAVAVFLPQALSFLTSILAIKFFGYAELSNYGTFMALLALGTTLAMASQTLVASQDSDIRNSVGYQLYTLINANRLIIIVGLMSAPMILLGLQLQPPMFAILLVLTSAIVYVSIAEGSYLGSGAIKDFAKLLFIANAFRIGGSLVGIMLGKDAISAALGMLLGALFAVKLAPGFGNLFSLVNKACDLGEQGLRRLAIQTSGLLSFFLLYSSDVLVSRWFLDKEVSGVYISGNVITKIVFFISAPLLFFAYPRMTGTAGLKTVWITFFTTSLSCGVLVLGIYIWPEATAGTLIGEKFENLEDVIWMYGLLGMLLALSQVLIYRQLAVKSTLWQIIPWFIVALFFAFGYMGNFVSNIDVLRTAILFQFITLGTLLIWTLYASKTSSEST